MTKLRDYKFIAAALAFGLILGVFWVLAIRAVLAKNIEPHFHANFAVFVGGERLKFEGPTFYEEVAACSDDSANPKSRVHMHDNIGHVVHVHEQGVTWGHFFANLRYGLSDNALALDDTVLVDGQNGQALSFILNGQPVDNIANKLIASEDRLLISYGPPDDARLKTEYQQVEQDAADYNRRTDPSACSGGKSLTFKQRLQRAFSVN